MFPFLRVTRPSPKLNARPLHTPNTHNHESKIVIRSHHIYPSNYIYDAVRIGCQLIIGRLSYRSCIIMYYRLLVSSVLFLSVLRIFRPERRAYRRSLARSFPSKGPRESYVFNFEYKMRIIWPDQVASYVRDERVRAVGVVLLHDVAGAGRREQVEAKLNITMYYMYEYILCRSQL